MCGEANEGNDKQLVGPNDNVNEGNDVPLADQGTNAGLNNGHDTALSYFASQEQSQPFPAKSESTEWTLENTTASRVLDSFVARDYNPPWWAKNGHINTIVGYFFTVPPIPKYQRER